MTLAVADSIHLLVTMLQEMRNGRGKREAIVESLRINLQPVFLTSLTTAIGFLSMNFSDAPPFRHLGNITATGVGIAFILSVVFLPAVMSVLPVRVKQRASSGRFGVERLAEAVVGRRRMLMYGSIPVILGLALCIPLNELNDSFVEYFSERVPFRTHTDFAMKNLGGLYQSEHSVGSDSANGISEPDYMGKLDEFADWYRAQPEVTHVNVISDTMKRLNKSMHGDDQEWYRLPDNRQLGAQYLLLYELSLPYGLDLNNQINLDKSATRLTATLANVSTQEIRGLAVRAEDWLRANAPEAMFGVASSGAIMFSHISKRNIDSMLVGTTLALVLISGVLILALRSLRIGIISLLPNLAPAVLAFGAWGIFVGQVNVGLSIVVTMTLGIVVDDTVHFLSKYLRARREQGLNAEDAVRYALLVGRPGADRHLDHPGHRVFDPVAVVVRHERQHGPHDRHDHRLCPDRRSDGFAGPAHDRGHQEPLPVDPRGGYAQCLNAIPTNRNPACCAGRACCSPPCCRWPPQRKAPRKKRAWKFPARPTAATSASAIPWRRWK